MRTTKTRRRIAAIGATVALLAAPIAAYAGTVFNDVDDTSSHIDGITWVKDAGVSVGCDNNGNYCPGDNVTRAQMGTFMYRLSGNDPNTSPSVHAAYADEAGDADTVDGFDASEMIRVAYDQVANNALVGVDGTAASATIEAPGPGFLVISASADVFGLNSDVIVCKIQVNDADIAASARAIELDTPNNSEDDCATDAVYTMIFGGTQTVDLEFVSMIAGNTVDEAVLTVLYVPFNGEGNQPEIVIAPLSAGTTDELND